MDPVDASKHANASNSTHNFSAFFEKRHAADAAKAEIVAAGLSIDAVKITDGLGSVTANAASAPREGSGFVATLKNIWDQETHERPAERAGHGYVLTAHVPLDRAAEIRDILGRDGSITDDYE